MGLRYSIMELIGTAAKGDRVEKIRDDRRVVTYKSNPIVTSVAAGILIVYMDGGNGLISNMFRRLIKRGIKSFFHS